MSELVDNILALHQRVKLAGFGTVTLPPREPLHGPVGMIQVKPLPAEQDDLVALLTRMMGEYQFVYQRDQAIFRFQNGSITLVEITFMI